MSLHQLRSVTVGVPELDAVAEYYSEFGLRRDEDDVLATAEGGRQLMLEIAPSRRLAEVVVGVDDDADLERAHAALAGSGDHAEVGDGNLRTVERETGLRVVLQVAGRSQPAPTGSGVSSPTAREGRRAEAVLRSGPVRPSRLGHAVLTTTNLTATSHFFVDLLGFRVSDHIGDAGIFLRCSTDHHNLLLLQAPSVYLHHTAWKVADVDEVGRGATAMLAGHPERHVWGLGRHHAGANYFWYLRDPAGNYSEYYSDLDVIPEDAEWTPETHEGHLGLYSWGPPPPATFLRPADQVRPGSAPGTDA